MKTLFKSAPVQVQHLKPKTLFSLYGNEHPFLTLGYTRNKEYIRCRKYLTSATYVIVKFDPNAIIESILNINDNIII